MVNVRYEPSLAWCASNHCRTNTHKVSPKSTGENKAHIDNYIHTKPLKINCNLCSPVVHWGGKTHSMKFNNSLELLVGITFLTLKACCIFWYYSLLIQKSCGAGRKKLICPCAYLDIYHNYQCSSPLTSLIRCRLNISRI